MKIRMDRHWAMAAVLAAVVLLTIGCGGGSSPTGLEAKGLVKGTVTLGGVSAAGAVVYIDGTYFGTTGTDGSFIADLPPGQHTLWLVIGGRQTSRVILTIGEEDLLVGLAVTRAPDGSLVLEATVVAVTTPTVLTESAALDELVTAVEALDETAFAKGKRKEVFLKKIAVVAKNAEQGNVQGAYQKLAEDIAPKTDGCVATGAPDANDWIIDCAAQQTLDPLIAAALEELAAAIVPDEE